MEGWANMSWTHWNYQQDTEESQKREHQLVLQDPASSLEGHRTSHDWSQSRLTIGTTHSTVLEDSRAVSSQLLSPG